MAIKKRDPFLGIQATDLLCAQDKNKYQAVLAAAKMARRLNEAKVAEYEAEPDADRTLEAHKVTSMALEMLLRGEIEFHPLREKAEEAVSPL